MKNIYLITTLALVALALSAASCKSSSGSTKSSRLSGMDLQVAIDKINAGGRNMVQFREMPPLDYAYDDWMRGARLMDTATLRMTRNVIKEIIGECETMVQARDAVVGKRTGEAAQRALAAKFTDIDKANNLFAQAEEMLVKGRNLTQAIDKAIAYRNANPPTVPTGELTYYSDKTYGGMRMGYDLYQLKRDGGKTTLTTYSPETGDEVTVEVGDTVMARVGQMVLDHKVYAIAALSKPMFMIFDAPSWKFEARFADGTHLTSHGESGMPHGTDGIYEIRKYLYEIIKQNKQ